MLNSSAQLLQDSQNNLSNSYLGNKFSKEIWKAFNPMEVTLLYDMPTELPMFFVVEIWSAIMEVAVHAYTVKELPMPNITMKNTSVFFILKNTLNSILDAIWESTSALLIETINISS